jgi:ethanolamine utilization cobalamin adenosyltransferase
MKKNLLCKIEYRYKIDIAGIILSKINLSESDVQLYLSESQQDSFYIEEITCAFTLEFNHRCQNSITKLTDNIRKLTKKSRKYYYKN